MRASRILVAALLLVAGIVGSPAIAEVASRRLNSAQITLLFSGSEVDADEVASGGCDWARRYKFDTDGTFSASAECQFGNPMGANVKTLAGKWSVADDRLCLEYHAWKKGEAECWILANTDTGFAFTNSEGWPAWWLRISNPRFPSKEALMAALEERRGEPATQVTTAYNAEDLAKSRAEAERQSGEAEKLRKQLAEAKRERVLAAAERKAVEDMRRAAEEETRRAVDARRETERRAAELERREEAAKVRERAKAKRDAAQPPVTQDQATEARLAAIQKQLQELARQRSAQDTGLPTIRVNVPDRVEVGDAKRITGLVGDNGSPPRLKVNGKLVALYLLRAGEESVASHTLAFRIDIDAVEVGERRYTLEACDGSGNCMAEDIALRVVVANRPDLAARNFALIIGNNDYVDLPDLKTAAADATAVAEVLTSRYAFERGNVKLLLNVGRRTILKQLAQFRRRLREDDRLLIYYGGHGEIDPASEAGFWLPVDAEAGEQYTWIANDDIRRELKGISAKHVLVVADSCFSGTLTRSKPSYDNIPKDRFFTEIDSHVSRKAISSGGTEPVADAGTGGHSVFAYYLLKTLRDNKRPYITSLELFQGLARAVTNNSSQKPEYGIVGGAGDEGSGDFTFILKKTGS